MKLKVWARNLTAHPIDVALTRWYLLVPGASPAKYWSAPAGYPRPKLLRPPEGPVTAIPANPDGAAEEIGDEYNFATPWKKTQLEPGESWRPPLLNPDGTPYRDGTLVFYVPLVQRDGRLYGPTVLGLARVRAEGPCDLPDRALGSEGLRERLLTVRIAALGPPLFPQTLRLSICPSARHAEHTGKDVAMGEAGFEPA